MFPLLESRLIFNKTIYNITHHTLHNVAALPRKTQIFTFIAFLHIKLCSNKRQLPNSSWYIHNISTDYQYFTNRSVSSQSTVSSWLSIRSLIRSTFWANVNSCRRKSVCLSVWLSSVFSLSVTFGHPTQRLKFSAMFLRHSVPWPSIDIQVKFYRDCPRGGGKRKRDSRI